MHQLVYMASYFTHDLNTGSIRYVLRELTIWVTSWRVSCKKRELFALGENMSLPRVFFSRFICFSVLFLFVCLSCVSNGVKVSVSKSQRGRFQHSISSHVQNSLILTGRAHTYILECVVYFRIIRITFFPVAEKIQ